MKESFTEPDRMSGKMKLIQNRIDVLEDGILEYKEMTEEILTAIWEIRGRISKYLEQVEITNDNDK